MHTNFVYSYHPTIERTKKTARKQLHGQKLGFPAKTPPKKQHIINHNFAKIESGGQNHKSIAGSLKAKVNKRRGTGRGSCKHKAKAKNKHSAFENRETQKSPITRQAANEELPNRRK